MTAKIKGRHEMIGSKEIEIFSVCVFIQISGIFKHLHQDLSVYRQVMSFAMSQGANCPSSKLGFITIPICIEFFDCLEKHEGVT